MEQANRRNYIFSPGDAELQPLVLPCAGIRMYELMKVLSSDFTVCNRWKVCPSSTNHEKVEVLWVDPLQTFLRTEMTNVAFAFLDDPGETRR